LTVRRSKTALTEVARVNPLVSGRPKLLSA
jgi:hypothetical protein